MQEANQKSQITEPVWAPLPILCTSVSVCKIFTRPEWERKKDCESKGRWATPMHARKTNTREKEGGMGVRGEALEYWNKQSRCSLLFSASCFWNALHIYHTPSPSLFSPRPLPILSFPSPPSFLHASRTLKSLRGAAALRSNESVCCHFSDAWCEIKRAVYVRAVAGIKRQAHIGRRQLLQSLQAHIYVPFVQFAICRTKPIF